MWQTWMPPTSAEPMPRPIELFAVPYREIAALCCYLLRLFETKHGVKGPEFQDD